MTLLVILGAMFGYGQVKRRKEKPYRQALARKRAIQRQATIAKYGKPPRRR